MVRQMYMFIMSSFQNHLVTLVYTYLVLIHYSTLDLGNYIVLVEFVSSCLVISLHHGYCKKAEIHIAYKITEYIKISLISIIRIHKNIHRWSPHGIGIHRMLILKFTMRRFNAKLSRQPNNREFCMFPNLPCMDLLNLLRIMKFGNHHCMGMSKPERKP